MCRGRKGIQDADGFDLERSSRVARGAYSWQRGQRCESIMLTMFFFMVGALLFVFLFFSHYCDCQFSGHEGTWKDNNAAAQVFDKGYYAEMLDNDWRMRNLDGGSPQDWSTGVGSDNGRMMLNTDMCLAYDIDIQINNQDPSCTTLGNPSCPRYAVGTSRRAALDAVLELKDCDQNNDCFYTAFRDAWLKATVLGQSGATKSLTLTCV